MSTPLIVKYEKNAPSLPYLCSATVSTVMTTTSMVD